MFQTFSINSLIHLRIVNWKSTLRNPSPHGSKRTRSTPSKRSSIMATSQAGKSARTKSYKVGLAPTRPWRGLTASRPSLPLSSAYCYGALSEKRRPDIASALSLSLGCTCAAHPLSLHHQLFFSLIYLSLRCVSSYALIDVSYRMEHGTECNCGWDGK